MTFVDLSEFCNRKASKHRSINSRTNHSIFRWFLSLHWLFLDLFSALFDIFRLFCDTSFRFVSFRCISFRFISFSFLSLVVPYISFRFVILHFVSFRFFIFRFVSLYFVSFHFVSFRFVFISQLSSTYILNMRTMIYVTEMGKNLIKTSFCWKKLRPKGSVNISHHSSQLRLIPYLHHIEGEKRTHPRFADCISHSINWRVLSPGSYLG
jgi:hypothetical protein